MNRLLVIPPQFRAGAKVTQIDSEGVVLVEAPRPTDGSPEDLAHMARCATLRAALERVRHSILPGSPSLEDELRARRDFADDVLHGHSIDEALTAIWERARTLAKLR
jgi:hypothetical protein